MKRVRLPSVFEYIENKKQKQRNEIVKEYKLDNVETIEDLLNVCCMLYDPNIPKNIQKTFKFDRIKLMRLVPSLIKLNNLVGMTKIKQCITRIIIQFMSGIIDKNEYMLHMAIYGPPGVGKSTVINILAEIYGNLGILSKGHIEKVGTSDLIAKYVGQTSHMTKKVLERSLGGILVLDEAYSLGNNQTKHGAHEGFTKECIDEINKFIEMHKDDFVCIIAGYQTDIEQCFFAHNQGLSRRFPYKIKIDEYTPVELEQIFRLKIKQNKGWRLSQDNILTSDFFKDNDGAFKHQGGSIENLWNQIQQSHIQRVAFTGNDTEKKVITIDDLNKGLDLLKSNETKTEEINYSISLYS
jgi:SpoVK/Ycf46/Vps4 family AAA+-type ATPase